MFTILLGEIIPLLVAEIMIIVSQFKKKELPTPLLPAEDDRLVLRVYLAGHNS